MGFRFRKTKKIGPFRITLSKSGISTSVGIKGFRITKTASGKLRTTASVPGTGLSYVSEVKSKNSPLESKKPSAAKKPLAKQPEEKNEPLSVDDRSSRYLGKLPPFFYQKKAEDYDCALEDCARFIIATGKATIKDLQQEFQFGYSRCARIMDQLEEVGIVGPYQGAGPRCVLLSPKEQE